MVEKSTRKVDREKYASTFEAADLRKVLKANVLKLLEDEEPLRPSETGIGRLKKLGVRTGLAQRLLGGETSVGIENVALVARKLGVTPWRLLRPQGDGVRPEPAPDRECLRLAERLQRLAPKTRRALQTLIEALETDGRGYAPKR
jgi:hypothetical protein